MQKSIFDIQRLKKIYLYCNLHEFLLSTACINMVFFSSVCRLIKRHDFIFLKKIYPQRMKFAANLRTS